MHCATQGRAIRYVFASHTAQRITPRNAWRRRALAVSCIPPLHPRAHRLRDHLALRLAIARAMAEEPGERPSIDELRARMEPAQAKGASFDH